MVNPFNHRIKTRNAHDNSNGNGMCMKFADLEMCGRQAGKRKEGLFSSDIVNEPHNVCVFRMAQLDSGTKQALRFCTAKENAETKKTTAAAATEEEAEEEDVASKQARMKPPLKTKLKKKYKCVANYMLDDAVSYHHSIYKAYFCPIAMHRFIGTMYYTLLAELVARARTRTKPPHARSLCKI